MVRSGSDPDLFVTAGVEIVQRQVTHSMHFSRLTSNLKWYSKYFLAYFMASADLLGVWDIELKI